MDCLLSVKDAATRLACSEALLRKWMYTGRLPFVKVGRLSRLREQDLDAWVRLGLGQRGRGGQDREEDKGKHQAIAREGPTTATTER
jgi:excisionase family DNA binding protein